MPGHLEDPQTLKFGQPQAAAITDADLRCAPCQHLRGQFAAHATSLLGGHRKKGDIRRRRTQARAQIPRRAITREFDRIAEFTAQRLPFLGEGHRATNGQAVVGHDHHGARLAPAIQGEALGKCLSGRLARLGLDGQAEVHRPGAGTCRQIALGQIQDEGRHLQ